MKCARLAVEVMLKATTDWHQTYLQQF